jgi:hypothetical protein
LPGSIGAMLLLAFLLGQALGLPEVENPIPEKIGLEDVFTVAGAGGMFGVCCSSKNKERAIGVGSVVGLCVSAAFYVFALLVQVASAYEIFCPRK